MEVGYALPPVAKEITEDLLSNYSRRYPGIFVQTIHVDRKAAGKWGFPDLVLQGSQTMNFVAEMLFKVYRENWIKDSSLSVKFILPVFAGDTVTAKGLITENEKDTEGKVHIKLDVWAENRLGEKVMVGEAKVTI